MTKIKLENLNIHLIKLIFFNLVNFTAFPNSYFFFFVFSTALKYHQPCIASPMVIHKQAYEKACIRKTVLTSSDALKVSISLVLLAATVC